MTLADLTSASLVSPRLRGRTPADIVRELGALLRVQDRIPDLDAFSATVLRRENLASTLLLPGMAFPHGRLPHLRQLSLAVGRCEPPVNWGNLRPQPVHCVFLIAIPEEEVTQHLQLLASLARLGREESPRCALIEAATAEQILKALERIPLGPFAPGQAEVRDRMPV